MIQLIQKLNKCDATINANWTKILRVILRRSASIIVRKMVKSRYIMLEKLFESTWQFNTCKPFSQILWRHVDLSVTVNIKIYAKTLMKVHWRIFS